MLISNSLKYVSKSLTFGPKLQFHYFKPTLSAILLRFQRLKKINVRFFILSYSSKNKQLDEIGEKQLSVFGTRRGHICPLVHVPLMLTYDNMNKNSHLIKLL